MIASAKARGSGPCIASQANIRLETGPARAPRIRERISPKRAIDQPPDADAQHQHQDADALAHAGDGLEIEAEVQIERIHDVEDEIAQAIAADHRQDEPRGAREPAEEIAQRVAVGADEIGARDASGRPEPGVRRSTISSSPSARQPDLDQRARGLLVPDRPAAPRARPGPAPSGGGRRFEHHEFAAEAEAEHDRPRPGAGRGEQSIRALRRPVAAAGRGPSSGGITGRGSSRGAANTAATPIAISAAMAA